MRVLRPGLKAVRYTGKIETKFRGAAEGRSYIKVSPDDVIIVTAVNAVRLSRGTQYEMVDTDVDITSLLAAFLAETPLEVATNEELLGELVKRGVIEQVDVFSADGDTDLEDSEVSGQDTAKAAEEAHSTGSGTAHSTGSGTAHSTSSGTSDELREATKENVMELNTKELKAACKKYGITIGKKKNDTLVALLLPYLENA